jgi:hypothetical protein
MEEEFDPASLEPMVATETDRRVVETFKNLLENRDVSPKQVADKINTLFSERLSARGDKSEDETAATFLWNLWVLLDQIVQECPISKLESITEVLQELRSISSRVVHQDGVSHTTCSHCGV